MAGLFLPCIADLRDLFIDQVSHCGGTVQDVFCDAHQLYARARLPQVEEVRRRDRVQNGIAMCATGPRVQVHPYTFREVCSNGAVMPRVIGLHGFERIPEPASEWEVGRVCTELTEAIAVSCSSATFARSIRSLRETTLVQYSAADHLVLLSHTFSKSALKELLPQVMRRLETSDHTAFSFLNAVTSLARDTKDPRTRWRLEELGGSIGARLQPSPHEQPPALATAGF